jgi:GAF domain-containing protein
VLRTGHPLLADRAEIERLHGLGEVHSLGARSVCWLGVPLVCSERTVGVLAVQSYSPDVRYTERDQELLMFVSYHIANGLERKRAGDSLLAAYADLERRVGDRTQELADANRELRDQIAVREQIEQKLKYEAMHDGLTGLPEPRVPAGPPRDARWRATSATGAGASPVLFLDLDRFKIVNDSMGHLTGDELLKEAGARLPRPCASRTWWRAWAATSSRSCWRSSAATSRPRTWRSARSAR